MHKYFLAPLVGTMTLLASVSATAADSGKDKVAAASSFATLDRNRDDRLSRSEAGFDRLLSQTFAEIDSDGDGFVSPAEFAAAEKTRTTAASNVTAR